MKLTTCYLALLLIGITFTNHSLAQTTIPDTKKALLGAWDGQMIMGSRSVPFPFAFFQDSLTFRGSMPGRRDEYVSLEKLNVTPATVSFEVTDRNRVISYSGKLENDGSIKGTFTQSVGDKKMDGTWTAIKSNEAGVPSVSTSQLLKQAKAAWEKSDTTTTRKLYNASLRINPNCIPCLVARGYYRERFSYKAALEDYAKALSIDSTNSGALIARAKLNKTMAMLYLLDGKRDSAIILYNNSIMDLTYLIPKNKYYAQATIGDTYFEMYKEVENINESVMLMSAMQAYTKAIAEKPSEPYAYFKRAEVYKALGEDDKAAADEAKGKSLEK